MSFIPPKGPDFIANDLKSIDEEVHLEDEK